MRPSKARYYLGIAEAVSKRSTCLRRQYGAVIVKDDEIIATGYNGSPRGWQNCCDSLDECPRKTAAHNSGDYGSCASVHAEMNAIISAARREMIGSTLYLWGYDSEIGVIEHPRPCPICERLINNAGINKVVSL